MPQFDDAKKIVAAYELIRQKALQLANGYGPPWAYIAHDECALVSFDGDDVVIKHPTSTSYEYDSCSIYIDVERFPAALLFMSYEELKAWKDQAQKKHDEELERINLTARAANEAQERATYETLKRKFEG